jgi:two-component system cell cycle sensor histidine kinase/response regulator CckA
MKVKPLSLWVPTGLILAVIVGASGVGLCWAAQPVPPAGPVAAMLALIFLVSLAFLLLLRIDAGIRVQQAALRESESFFTNMVAQSPLAIQVLDAGGRTLQVNRAFEELWGKAGFDPFAESGVQESLKQAFSGHSVALPSFEFTPKTGAESGLKHVVQTIAYPIKDKSGAVRRVTLIHRDVSDLRDAEVRVSVLLEESAQARRALLGILEDSVRAEAELKRLSTAIEQAAEIVVVMDKQGSVLYVNPMFETVTGYTRSEIVGRNLRVLKSGQQDEAFYRAMWKTISGGQTWQGRFVNRKKNGSLYTEEASISPVRDAAGSITSYVAVKRDITEELNLHLQLAQTQKMESVGRLAGGVAHDFNNILQAILGVAQLASEEADPAGPIRRDLDEIQSAARRAAALTRQLLAFARKQAVSPRILNLNEMVGGLLVMLRRIIGDIDLDLKCGENLWTVRMDPSQIDQILVNLCVNARDAIRGFGVVRIALENVRVDELCAMRYDGFPPGDYVLLTVSDTGCGMDKKTLDSIFEPFFTTKSTGAGTGLGLATVYGIVRQNQGQIGVYSELGKGTTFRIHLPRYLGEEVAQPAEDPPEPEVRGCETVLLVEDDPVILNTVARKLLGLGYAVMAAGAPEAALLMAEEHAGEIDLLVSDVVMPGMNGRDLAQRLMQKRPNLKCLFMSGFTADIIARHGVLDEGVHFIQKPFAMADLAAKMRTVAGG